MINLLLDNPLENVQILNECELADRGFSTHESQGFERRGIGMGDSLLIAIVLVEEFLRCHACIRLSQPVVRPDSCHVK